MTFSMLATDGTGAIGMAVTSSSPAVAARCIHLRPGVGGAASQNVTDPRLGTALLSALHAGLTAGDALNSVVRPGSPSAAPAPLPGTSAPRPGISALLPGTSSPLSGDLIEYRQLTVLTPDGEGAAFSGTKTLGVHHHRVAPGVVAAGNMLAGTDVIDAVVDGFTSSSGDLELRLLAALKAGLAAGGEAGSLHSAGLSVVREVAWRETDLRVDWSPSPVDDLAALVKLWLPQRDDYVTRGLDPTAAPSYGVPGDE
ncbi:DUF1028 domain-containing protein [Paractinoplanes atraurantiacus]|uniref:Uncharacterized conserved protein, Ntn-hydrolase superfamily n=1 Tax=Paractinoplanes atraurantiacus TaxID=1036182 RepID=A0A285IH54_9ACTN|nr:DUF1028 domain-containing protein [Actinoplanes atraurantiacus]SNY47294.1 Uncharacterized conserved protein, Ntn-hydrolase superfamily [Actinoplanes atraurantiacus]